MIVNKHGLAKRYLTPPALLVPGLPSGTGWGPRGLLLSLRDVVMRPQATTGGARCPPTNWFMWSTVIAKRSILFPPAFITSSTLQGQRPSSQNLFVLPEHPRGSEAEWSCLPGIIPFKQDLHPSSYETAQRVHNWFRPFYVAPRARGCKT